MDHVWTLMSIWAQTFLIKCMFSGPFQGRASIDGATVRLLRVTQADAGEYRCEVSAALDTIKLGETNVTLKVLGEVTSRTSLSVSVNIYSTSWAQMCVLWQSHPKPRHVTSRAPPWRAHRWSFAVRTNTASLQPATPGSKTRRRCSPYRTQTQPTRSMRSRVCWWESTHIRSSVIYI